MRLPPHPCTYSFEIFPIVYKCADNHRKDKRSDYVILKLRNKRTIVVVELKTLVGTQLTGDDKDAIAQLIYEGYLVCHDEKDHYKSLICVYANHASWHFF